MSIRRVASRYAKSLLDLSIERDQMEVVMSDIQVFVKALESRDFYLMLKSPIISSGKKKEIFKLLFEGKLSEMTYGFFSIVLTKGRESLLPEMVKEFMTQYKIVKNISEATLIVAAPISDAQMDQIRKKVSASSATLDNVEFDIEIDPSIIGGFIIKIGDKLYDASIRHKLDKLKKEVTGSSL